MDLTNKKEFIANIPILRFKSRKIFANDNNHTSHLFLTKIYPQTTPEPQLTFTLLSETIIYQKIFNYEEFKDYKESMGFEGSWKSFFTTLANAIENKEGGEIRIKPPREGKRLLKKSMSSSSKGNLNLNSITVIIVHPIAKDIKVSSEITLDKVNESNFNQIYFEVINELYETKVELSERLTIKDNENNLAILSNNNINNDNTNQENKNIFSNKNNLSGNINNNNSYYNLSQKVKQKRKFHSNLINPNIKKRKVKGVAFIQENEDDDNNDDDNDTDNNIGSK